MNNIFWLIIFGVLSTIPMEPASVPVKSTIKVPKQILETIFDGKDARLITGKINQLASADAKLQQFMQSTDNINAVINHVSKKTNAVPLYVAFNLGAMGWLKNEYQKGSISTPQMAALLNEAFVNGDINLLIQAVNIIPALSKFIFNDIKKTTFLLRALEHAQGFPLVQALISNGADVNQADAMGMTPLVYAINFTQTPALRELLIAGANVNKKTVLASPLYFAVKEGYLEGVKLLLNANADIDTVTLELAQKNNSVFSREEILKVLQEKLANPNKRFSFLTEKL